MEKYYKVTDVENIISKLLSEPAYQHPDEDFYCGVTGVETALISIPCYELSITETFNENKENLIKELFNNIAEAPTGGVDENFEIRPLKDGYCHKREMVSNVISEILFYCDTHKPLDENAFGEFLACLEERICNK